MRLHRLSLESWRGVHSRSIEFGPEVTLVEGPNEVGKSTIIEALRLLLTLRDDSKRQEVKAIAPVGQDVGSRVELEFSFGAYRAIYAKRFNKNRETILQLLQPHAEQVSGREAHERLAQLLDAEVDLTLWNALLVDQGAGVGQVSLQNSASLAAALDAAAGVGVAGDGEDNSTVFAAVQAEYETYFTLNKGAFKFSQLERDLAAAEAAVLEAQQGLQQVTQDVADQEALVLVVQEQQVRVPQLQTAYEQQADAVAGLTALQNQLQLAQQELKTLEGQNQAVLAKQQERADLARALEKSQQDLVRAQQSAAPLLGQLQQLGEQLTRQQQAIAQAKQQLVLATSQLQLASDDEQQAKRLAEVESTGVLLAEVAQYDQRLRELAEQQVQLLVTDSALVQLREAHAAVDLAQAKRDAAATTLRLEALADTTVELNGDALSLRAGHDHTKTVAERLQLELPGELRVTVEPSHSVAQMQEESTQSAGQWARLAAQYRVVDLDSAVAAQAQRAAVVAELALVKTRQAQLLQSRSMPEVQESLAALAAQCTRYQEQRTAETAAPQDLPAAVATLKAKEQALAQARASLDAARGIEEERRQTLDELRLQHASHQEIQVGQAATLEHQRQRMAALLTQATTDDLAADGQKILKQLERVQAVHDALATRWAAKNPEQLGLLRDNAAAALKRAQDELSVKQQRLAIIMDRLERGRASGKYDALEAATADRDSLAEQLDAVHARASAAQRLWKTLLAHRAAARSAYVAPLKTAIEMLGSIVFGQDFQVEVAADWTIVSRSVGGQTLPFSALSVGAQEQLALISRLAAAQITGPEGGVPLLVDDALGFSDPTRLAGMGAAIAAAGRRAQVIILTCSPGRFAHVGNAHLVMLADS